MDYATMLTNNKLLNDDGTPTTTTAQAVGGGIGFLVGGAFGNPLAGEQVGKAVGSVVSSFIPHYDSVRASVRGINFPAMKLKPYWLEVQTISIQELEKLDKIYKYFGVETQRVEPLNISNYLYNNHAFVRGTLSTEGKGGTIPLHRFRQINDIFQRGVHILNA